MVAYRGEGDGNAKAFEIAKTLFADGAKLGPFDRGILFFPISEGNIPLTALLLEKGASPTSAIEGYTPTELALKYGRKDIHEFLLSRGGIPVDKRDAAQLAFVHAAGGADIEGMEAAVKTGARIDESDPTGQTALIAAVRHPIYDINNAMAVWWILEKGADPNRKGESGFRGLEGVPLHIFMFMNAGPLNKPHDRAPQATHLSEETLMRLLRSGAKVSGMDSNGRTPLHVAAESDNVKGAEILIREGAKVIARDQKGKTPLDLAESAAMIRLLKSSGATEK